MMSHCSSHSVQQRAAYPTARLSLAAARRRTSVTSSVRTAATKQPSDLAPVVLKYFDLAIAGRGGGVALFLRHAGVPYTQDDVQYDASFQALKAQLRAPGGANPLGHLPLLYVNGAPEPLIDSHASTRYVARLLGLYGKDAEHDYKTDVVAAAAIEWRNDLLAARRDAALREPYVSQGGKRVQYYEAFEELLGRFGAQGATTVGGGSGLTYVDAHVFANLYDDAFVFGDDVRGHFPKLAAFHDTFAALPAVAQWILEKQQARDRKAQQQVAPPAAPGKA